MSRDDIQKLLGGYATGTLTPEEQQVLFEAALSDQELFDALAREEALREVLADPAARAQLLAATHEAPAPWWQHWWRPMLVVSAVLVALVGVGVWQSSQMPKPDTVAKVDLPRFQPPPEPQNAPVLLPPPPVVQPALPKMKALPLPPSVAPAPPPPAPVDAVRVLAPRMQTPQTQQAQTFGQMAQGQNFVGQVRVPLRGRVTDPTGSAVPSADIAVRMANGDTVNTSTDDRGEFAATAVPGGDYQVSVNKPGFQQAVVNGATPQYGTPPSLNVQLDASPAKDTVEVAASASAVAPKAEARSGLVGGLAGGRAPAPAAAPMLAMKAAPAIVQYELLRRVGDATPQPVPGGATVPAGSTLILRVTPTANGFLRIVDSTGTIASPAVRGQVPSEIVLPPFNRPGRVDLQIYFSAQAAEDVKKRDERPAATVTFNIQ